MPLPKASDPQADLTAIKRRKEIADRAAIATLQAKRSQMRARLEVSVEEAVLKNKAAGHATVTLWHFGRQSELKKEWPVQYAEMEIWRDLGNEYSRRVSKDGYKVKVDVHKYDEDIWVRLEVSWSTKR